MLNTIPTEVLSSRPTGDKRSHYVTVKCPVCSLTHTFCLARDDSYRYLGAPCDVGKGDHVLTFKFAALREVTT